MNWQPFWQNLPPLLNSLSLIVLAFCFRKIITRLDSMRYQIIAIYNMYFNKWYSTVQDDEELTPLQKMMRDQKAQKK